MSTSSETSTLLSPKLKPRMTSLVLPSRKRFLTGIVLLFCVVVLWTTSNFITSDLLEGGYDKPFLITYLNTSAFSLYLIPFLIKRWRPRSQQAHEDRGYLPVIQEDEEADQPASPTLPTHSPLAPRAIASHRSNSLIRSLSPSPALITHSEPNPLLAHPAAEAQVQAEEKLTMKETAGLAAQFCIVWFAANWTVNASLGLTSVGSSTVLAGMSGFFTLALGRIFGVETFTRAKIMAVLASFIGLILVTHSDSLLTSSLSIAPSDSLLDSSSPIHEPHVRRPILGDMLALLSAFCYAVYVILLKVRIGDEERVDMQLFFGFVGLFNTLFLLPLVPILSVLGVETFELPIRRSDWIVCAINMGITLSSDYLYVLAMLKTTPLVVTIGLSLTIPFAMLGDYLRGSTAALTTQAVIGAALVIVGFGLMGLEGWEEGTGETLTGVAEDEEEADDARGRGLQRG